MTEPILLTIADVLELTQLGRSRIYLEMGNGSLKVVRIGRAVRIRRVDLEEWLDRKVEESAIEHMSSTYGDWPPRR